VTTTVAPPIPEEKPFVIDFWWAIDQVDPAADNSRNAPLIFQQIYEPLLWWNLEKIELIPWLAEDWEVSNDGLTYTFFLRKEIRFHDGTPFNATAVKYNFDRQVIINDPRGSSPYFNVNLIGAKEYALSEKTQADVDAYLAKKAVEVIDDYTIVIHLKAPNAAFPFILATSVGLIVSPSWVESHGGIVPGERNDEMSLKGSSAGTGPFILKNWDPGTQTAVFVRNDDYWGSPFNTGPAKLKNVLIRVIRDPGTRILNIKSGVSDMTFVNQNLLNEVIDIDLWLNEGKIKTIVPGVKVNGPFPMLSVRYLGFNTNILDEEGRPVASQPFKNKKIREAMAYAFDYETFIEATYLNFAIQPNGPVPEGVFGYDSTIPKPKMDLDKAKALLQEAAKEMGFSPTNPLKVPVYYFSGHTTGKTAMTILASNVNQLNTGFILEPNAKPSARFFWESNKGMLPAYALGWPANYPDAHEHLAPFGDFRLGSGLGIATRVGYDNEEVQKLLDQEIKEQDLAKRAEIMHQITNLIIEDHQYIFIDQPSTVFTVRDNVHGWSIEMPTNIVLSNPTAGFVYLYPIYRE
jgi:peptide/nickel transport system substrate-binding protein